MNFRLRAVFTVVSFALTTLAAVGCGGSDSPGTGPTGSNVHHAAVSLSASLSKSAAATNAATVLHAAGLEIDKAHVLIASTSGASVRDTTISVTAVQLPLELRLDLPIDPAAQVRATITFLSGSIELHTGTAQLTAYSPDTPAGSIPTGAIAAEPVAPGSAATRVTIVPVGPSPVETPITLTAHGFLADNSEVTNAIFSWSVDDAAVATVSATGVLTPTSKGGTVHVTATTVSGSAAATDVRFYSTPTSIVVVSGDGQHAIAGAALAAPFIIEVRSSDGATVPNQTVTFGAANGSSVSPASAMTDAGGRAQTTVTLGHGAGIYGFSATTGSLQPASISATAVAGPPAAISKISGDAQSDTILKTLKNPLVVRVADQFDNPVPGVTVRWTRSVGVGSPTAGASITDGGGQTATTYTLGQVAGLESITARVDGVQTPATFTATALPMPNSASRLQFVQQPTTVEAGQRLAPAVTVRAVDASGNLVSSFNAPVSIGLDANPVGGVLAGTLIRSAINGVATFDDLTLSAAAAGYRLRATSNGLADATSANFTIAVPAPAPIIWSNAAGGSWSDPANWNLRRTPSTADSVVIGLAGTYTVTLDTTFTGSNIVIGDGGNAHPTLAMSARTLTIGKTLAVQPGATLLLGNAGSDVVAGAGTLRNSGMIRATVPVTVSAELVMNAGSQLTIAPTSGSATFAVAEAFTNNGQIHLAPASPTASATLLVGGATTQFVNAAGGVIDTPGAGGPSTIDAAISNYGTIAATNPLTITNSRNAAGGYSNNHGTLAVSPGVVLEIRNSKAFANLAPITIPAGATLAVNSSIFTVLHSAPIQGAGSLTMQNVTANLFSPIELPAVTISGGTLTLSVNLSRPASSVTTLNGVIVNGVDSLTNAAGSTMDVEGGEIHVPLLNQGDLVLGGEVHVFAEMTTTTSSSIRIQGTTTGTAPSAWLWSFTNNGTIQLTGGAAAGVDAFINMFETGTLNNGATGTIIVSSGGAGGARVTGTVRNAGTLSVAPNGQGSLFVWGAVTSVPSAVFDLHVGPALATGGITANQPGSSFQGTLKVESIGGSPPAGSLFTLLQYKTGSTISFSTTTLPDGSASWTTNIGATAYSITRK